MPEELTFDRIAGIILNIFIVEIRNNLWRLTFEDVAYRMAESSVSITRSSLALALQQMVANGDISYGNGYFSKLSKYPGMET